MSRKRDSSAGDAASQAKRAKKSTSITSLFLDLPKSRVFGVGCKPMTGAVEGSVLLAGNADGSVKIDPWFICDSLDAPWVAQMQKHLNPEDYPKTQKLKNQVQEAAMALCAKYFEKIGQAETDETRAEARKIYNEKMREMRLKIYKARVYPNPSDLCPPSGCLAEMAKKSGKPYLSDNDLKVPLIRAQSPEWATLRDRTVKLKPAEKKEMLKKLAHEDHQMEVKTGPLGIGNFRLVQQEKGKLDDLILACWLLFFYETVKPTEDNPVFLVLPEGASFNKIPQWIIDWDLPHLELAHGNASLIAMDSFIIPQVKKDVKKMADEAQAYTTAMDGSRSMVKPIHAVNFFCHTFVHMMPDVWCKQWGCLKPYYCPEVAVVKKPTQPNYYNYWEKFLERRAQRRSWKPVFIDRLVEGVTDEQIAALSALGTPETAAKWAEVRAKTMPEETAKNQVEEDVMLKEVKRHMDFIESENKRRAEREAAKERKRLENEQIEKAKKEALRLAKKNAKAKAGAQQPPKMTPAQIKQQQAARERVQQQAKARMQQPQPYQPHNQFRVQASPQQYVQQGQPMHHGQPGQPRQQLPNQQRPPQGPPGQPMHPGQQRPGQPGQQFSNQQRPPQGLPGQQFHPQGHPQGHPPHPQGPPGQFNGPPPMGYQQFPPQGFPPQQGFPRGQFPPGQFPQGAPMYPPHMQQQQQRPPLNNVPPQNFNQPPQGKPQGQAPQGQAPQRQVPQGQVPQGQPMPQKK